MRSEAHNDEVSIQSNSSKNSDMQENEEKGGNGIFNLFGLLDLNGDDKVDLQDEDNELSNSDSGLI